MDIIALGFYAVICGLLSVFAPQLGTFYIRFGIGATIGAISAIALPFVKGAIGGY